MMVQLGWSAPTISEQFPQLPPHDAEHFQRDHIELSRLKIRGMLTDAEHQRAIGRFAKKVSAALASLQGDKT
jgi:hypothetical protein